MIESTFLAGVVANALHRVSNHLLVVDRPRAGDLPEDHDHARLGHRLAGHLRVRVQLEEGVEDGVADLVAHFV